MVLESLSTARGSILVVEDDHASADLLAALLEEEGFQPVVVRVKEFAARAWLLRPHAYWLCGSCTAAAA